MRQKIIVLFIALGILVELTSCWSQKIIGFSKDGSLAWLIGKLKVAGKRTMEDGSQLDMDFTCAWITLYERKGDRWIRLGEVSSFK